MNVIILPITRRRFKQDQDEKCRLYRSNIIRSNLITICGNRLGFSYGKKFGIIFKNMHLLMMSVPSMNTKNIIMNNKMYSFTRFIINGEPVIIEANDNKHFLLIKECKNIDNEPYVTYMSINSYFALFGQ